MFLLGPTTEKHSSHESDEQGEPWTDSVRPYDVQCGCKLQQKETDDSHQRYNEHSTISSD